MEHVIVQKPWGHEIWFANNDLYCGKEIFVRNGRWSSGGKFHYHKKKDETFYVIEGRLRLDYYDYTDFAINAYGIERDLDFEITTVHLKKGQSLRLKPYMWHRFKGHRRSCTFIEASTHHEDADSYYE